MVKRNSPRVLLFVFVLFITSIFANVKAQTILEPGDLALLTINADGDKNFDILLLKDIEVGTQLFFTDKAFIANQNGFRDGEGVVEFLASKAYTKGEIISYSGKDDEEFSETGSFTLSGSGDNLIIFQGSIDVPEFIFGLGWALHDNWIYDETKATNTSDIPPNLSECNFTMVQLGNKDNYQYNIENGAAFAGLSWLKILSNTENFLVDDGLAFSEFSSSLNVLESFATELYPSSPVDRLEIDNISSLADTILNAQQVFSFNIVDFGNDGKSANVKSLSIYSGFNEGRLPNLVSDAFLERENGDMLMADTIMEDQIVFLTDHLLVPNGGSEKLVLKMAVQNYNLTEGDSLSFYIPQSCHNWWADDSGSQVQLNFPQSIFSDTFAINVLGTKLTASMELEEVTVDDSLMLEFILTDRNGNMDLSNEFEFTLKLFELDSTEKNIHTELKCIDGIVLDTLVIDNLGEYFFELKEVNDKVPAYTSSVFRVVGKATSNIIPSEKQLSSQSISSLTINKYEAVPVIGFRVVDNGDDNTPTCMQHLKLLPGDKNTADWPSHIQGFTISTGEVVRQSIRDNYIELEFQGVKVKDGKEKDIAISMYLNEDDDLADNSAFQFLIDSADHKLATDGVSSRFTDTLTASIISPIHRLEVIASKIQFESYPKRIAFKEYFTVYLQCTDEFGNLDLDNNSSIEIRKHQGSGNMYRANEDIQVREFYNGIAVFDSIWYSHAENFTMAAISGQFENIYTDIILGADTNTEISGLWSSDSLFTVSSKSNSYESSFPIGKFLLIDSAAHDNLPTTIKKLNFFTFFDNNEVLIHTIQGAKLVINDTLSIETSIRFDESVVYLTPDEDIIVPSGDSTFLEIHLFLQKGNLEDGLLFNCSFSPGDWHYSDEGSIISLDTIFQSPTYRIDVQATKLNVVNLPLCMNVNEPISLDLEARDNFGNGDLDFDGILNLRLLNQSRETIWQSVLNMENGKAKTDSFSCVLPGTYFFEIRDEADALKHSICNLSIENADTIVFEDFETNELSNWSGAEGFIVSSVNPISGMYSLIKNIHANSEFDNLMYSVDFTGLNSEKFIWQFQIKGMDFDPSSTNNFGTILLSDGAGTNYLAGVNLNSANDKFCLIKQSDQETETILETDLVWKENMCAGIQIELARGKEWRIAYDNNGEFDNLLFTETTHAVSNNSFNNTGICIRNSDQEKTGHVLFDDFVLLRARMKPIIDSIALPADSLMTVFFNKQIQLPEIGQLKIQSENFSARILKMELKGKGELHLELPYLPNGEYSLIAENIIDEFGMLSIKQTINFYYQKTLRKWDVVINEIMADPDPTVQLPNAEFVELHNRTSETICTAGWKLIVGDEATNLDSTFILPESYSIICSRGDSLIFSNYGNVIPTQQNFSINNSLEPIKLLDETGKTISFLDLELSDFGDEKSAGGWSLECVDYNNLSGSSDNWKFSIAASGGTPGTKNSILAVNRDTIAPFVTQLEFVNEYSIQLCFNEPMQESSLVKPENYLSKAIRLQNYVEIDSVFDSWATLFFTEKISADFIYELQLTNMFDLAGNKLILSAPLLFSAPQQIKAADIIINEIMFNPTPEGADFIELYNRSNKTFDLSKLYISDNGIAPNPLCTSSQLLLPAEYIVLCENKKQLQKTHECYSSRILEINMPSMPDNSGSIFLANSYGDVVSALYYEEQWHTEILADREGVSLELVNPDADISDKNYWKSASQQSGFATPGMKNSQFIEIANGENEFNMAEELISPNGDGFNDFLVLNYNFSQSGMLLNLRVFDVQGREVSTIAENYLAGTSGIITWDGTRHDGSRAPSGMYLIYIEKYNLNGDLEIIKKVCVIGN